MNSNAAIKLVIDSRIENVFLVGIAVKRIWHHPEMIMFFHLPAAVFLAMAGRSIPVKLRQRYREQVRSMDIERL